VEPTRKIAFDIVQLAKLMRIAEQSHSRDYAVRFLIEEAVRQPSAFYDMLVQAGEEIGAKDATSC
jgi:hypothetical protein